MAYTAEAFQNEFLALGATEVNAIVTVTSSGAEGGRRTAGATEIIIVDCSGSMQAEGRMVAARQAAKAAVNCIDDGVRFAIIAGVSTAQQLFPAPGQLAVATPEIRAQAVGAIDRLQANGGTAMGAWLKLAHQLFAQRPGDIQHAILLTDGENGEYRGYLENVLQEIGGSFTCDCRGIGTSWQVSELRKIATAMLGSVDIVARPQDLAAAFEQMMTAAMGKTSADVQLKVWTPVNSTVRFVKQVEPQVTDLTGKRTEDGPRAGRYPLGAWGSESRDYHVCIDVTAGAAGDEMLAARVSVVEGETVHAQCLVRAVWTDDAALSTRINRQVAHYTGQAELADAIQAGIEARKAGDDRTATLKFGRAAQLAHESGNKATEELLATVVEIEDAATGTVRLRRKVDAADEMALDTRSTKTVRVGRAQ
ncbi:VWA domain-containing protein [Actinoplanes sp. NBRC 14428]|uniref:von Willebrand factor type A domain-containing protein n=1 Tax=Pseudosporangium ferrugineum TaxID=439699 RepID=A0A2T0SJI5_9ACTN|nr:VWA domain-containing protein [Pseudosporangium ferrugineum]PRY33572.1 von Willebrand factor type A domain-containing protein [Pseudosporangium ferrugineum]BCJ56478.1 VWA domain-containing protein [Actinoplanes sp. NBRC 14428]